MSRITKIMSIDYKKMLLPNTYKELNIIFGISILFSVFVNYLLLDFLNTGKQKYTDIIVGSITWQDFYKSFDYLVVISFFTIFFLCWFLTLTLIRYLKKDNHISGHTAKFVKLNEDPLKGLVFGLLFYSIALWIVKGDFPELEFLVTGAIAILSFISGNEKKKYVSKYHNIIPLILSILFFYFSVIGIFTLIKFIDSTAFINNPLFTKNFSVRVTYIATIVGILLLLRNKLSITTWRKVVYYSQLLIPLLLLVLIKGSYQQQQTITLMNIPTHTMIVVYLIIGLCLLYNLKVIYTKKVSESGTLSSLILTPTLFSIAVFMAYRIPSYSALTSDDFHLGEIILPWHQIVQLNQSMYSEFVSVQGLMGIMYGGINNLFFAGSASSFPLAITLFYTLIAGISIVLLSRLIGNTWALLFSISILPITDRYYIVLPILLVLCSPRLIRKPLLWVLVWGFLSLFHCFYNPSVGAALTAVSLPIAIWMLVKSYSNKHIHHVWANKKWMLLSIVAGIVITIVLLIPSIFGIISYVLDNGSVNTNGYGISIYQAGGIPAWFPMWFSSHVLNELFWESIRIGGWIIGIIVMWYLINRFYIKNTLENRTDSNNNDSDSVSIFAFISICFIFTMVPYSMGRIDPGALSRPGSVSLLILTTLIPIFIVLMSRNIRINKFMVSGTVGLLLGLSSIFSYQHFSDLPIKATQSIMVPEGAQYVRGSEIGLPNLGNIFIDAGKLEEINKFKLTIDLLLNGGETYYDLTNRSLYYYLVDKKVPGIYSADYLAANYEIQTKTLNAIEENQPPIVWIGPSMRHDNAPSSLRSYRIYRWLINENYQYYEKNGFQFLLRNDRYQEIINSETKRMENGNILPSLMEWVEKYSVGDKQIINPYTMKVKKEQLGWYHSYVTIPVIENQKYVFKMDTVLSDRGRTYVYVEFYNEDNKVGDITSPFIESSQNVDFLFAAPQGTTRMEFGLVIGTESEGTFEFNNAQLLYADGQIAANPEYRAKFNGDSLAKVFHQKELQSIPIAWGRSLTNLKQRFSKDAIGSEANGVNLVLKHNIIESNGGLSIDGDDPYLVWNIANGLNGSEFDFLEINLDTDTDNLFRGQIYWSETGDEFSEDKSFVFNAQKGNLLIPLGSHPNWLTSTNITNIRIDIDGYTGEQFQVSYEFLRLVK